jgi:hypothetical protein
MDFVLKGKKGNDDILVIVDRLTKSALFLPMKMMDLVEKFANLYMNEIIRLLGVTISIVSHQDQRLTSRL